MFSRQQAVAVPMDSYSSVHDDTKQLCAFIYAALPSRDSHYVKEFMEKLKKEGIEAPPDLLRVSLSALEEKLSTNQNFNVGEMADTIRLRSAARPPHSENAGSTSRKARRGRSSPSRSRSPRGKQRDGRRSPPRGSDNAPKPHRRRNNRYHRHNKRQSSRNMPPHGRRKKRDARRSPPGGSDNAPKLAKPELWAAAERCDELAVQQQLIQGMDPDEKYDGWTPLMKAAEENGTEVIKALLDRRADINAVNKKGRSALSFAAAPSRNKDTPVNALRLLLERGADAQLASKSGHTPRQYAPGRAVCLIGGFSDAICGKIQ